MFGNAISSVAATEFLKDGAVAVVPKNADKLILSVLCEGSFDFAVPDEDVANVTMLNLGFYNGWGVVRIFLELWPIWGFGDGWTDMSEIADLLNIGAIKGSHSPVVIKSHLQILARRPAKEGRLVASMAEGDPYWGA